VEFRNRVEDFLPLIDSMGHDAASLHIRAQFAKQMVDEFGLDEFRGNIEELCKETEKVFNLVYPIVKSLGLD